MKGKRVLVVYAHPEPKSFSGAIKNVIVETLQKEGAIVQVSDLYAMNFNPVVGFEDFEDRADPSQLKVFAEQRNAVLKGQIAEDAKAELDKVLFSDFLITVSPVWWGTQPAILKGWFDRVLMTGGAWDFGKMFQGGLLKGRKALNVVVAGIPKEQYANMAGQNFDDRMHHLTHATMAFCGYDVIQYKSYHSVGYAPAEVRASYLEDIHNYVKNLDQQPIMDKMSQ